MVVVLIGYEAGMPSKLRFEVYKGAKDTHFEITCLFEDPF